MERRERSKGRAHSRQVQHFEVLEHARTGVDVGFCESRAAARLSRLLLGNHALDVVVVETQHLFT